MLRPSIHLLFAQRIPSAAVHATTPSSPATLSLGTGILVIGAVGFVASGALALLGRGLDGSTLAGALALVVLGLGLRFPTLLQDGAESDGARSVSKIRWLS